MRISFGRKQIDHALLLWLGGLIFMSFAIIFVSVKAWRIAMFKPVTAQLIRIDDLCEMRLRGGGAPHQTIPCASEQAFLATHQGSWSRHAMPLAVLSLGGGTLTLPAGKLAGGVEPGVDVSGGAIVGHGSGGTGLLRAA